MTKRYALTMGCNYPGTSMELAGCVNDAIDWAQALLDRGYDVQTVLDSACTRQRMLDETSRIVGRARWGDRVVITWSGHGTWVPDTSGDEADGRDEAIVPVDVHTAGVIIDDDLNQIFSRRRRGVRLLTVLDSCYSGTATRAVTVDQTTALKMELAPNGYTRRGAGVRFLPPAEFLDGPALARAQHAQDAPARGLSRNNGVLLSGCAEDEVSYDARYGGRANGALTHAALAILDTFGGPMNYVVWHKGIRMALPSVQYPQSPQLDGSWLQKRWIALA